MNRHARRNAIVLAYAVALGPSALKSVGVGDALAAIREKVSADVTEGELRSAIEWAIRKSKRDAARFERTILRPASRPRRRAVRLRIVR